mmetsp:Transcript_11866/g.13492  ORF Transcript_11866/g.13492 Transcript_11866/m.13492 type:complete len:88 (+) Transcript_11866:199-462(+)
MFKSPRDCNAESAAQASTGDTRNPDSSTFVEHIDKIEECLKQNTAGAAAVLRKRKRACKPKFEDLVEKKKRFGKEQDREMFDKLRKA